jgi:hypothetical protein
LAQCYGEDHFIWKMVKEMSSFSSIYPYEKKLNSYNLSSVVLEPKRTIYDNVAQLLNYKGRAIIELVINPNPLALWDFECLDKVALANSNFSFDMFFPPNEINNLLADNITILKPRCKSISGTHGKSKNKYSEFNAYGYSREFIIGEITSEFDALHIYIPNFFVHALCNEHTIKNSDSRWKYGDKSTYIFDVDFINDWTISFETSMASCDWMNNRFGNVGILITTIAKLWTKKEAVNKKTTLEDLKKEIEQLFMLLSFANGGYTNPILYCSFNTDAKDSRFIYFNSERKITSLEDIGESWFRDVSDLKKYIECYNEFSSLLRNGNWYSAYKLVLANYLIAISTDSWQIAASSIGAVIERLSYLILIEDERNATVRNSNKKLFNSGQSKKRLITTLEKIGLDKERKINDIDIVPDFINTRNDAVHPKNRMVPDDNRWEYVRYGIQWAEEIFLYRIGYSGWYGNRISKNERDHQPFNAGHGNFVPRYFVKRK